MIYKRIVCIKEKNAISQPLLLKTDFTLATYIPKNLKKISKKCKNWN